MSLSTPDPTFLAERQIPHEITTEGGLICVVLPDWVLASGYDRVAADLLLRLVAGYPDVAPDMWWFSPAASLSNGQSILATNVTEYYLGRQ